MLKKIAFFSFIMTLPLILTGCITVKTGAKVSAGADGGFYRSDNRGVAWLQKTLIPTVSGKPNTFADSDMASMAIDPSDQNTIYFGTEGYGLLYSYDAGESWFVAKSLGSFTISALAVDPKVRCTLYASIGNVLKKSTDCARTWEDKFTDDNAKAVIDHIVVDNNNSLKVYISTTKGGFYKSLDGGYSWSAIEEIANLRDHIVSITILPSDPRYLIVSLLNQGVYRTEDGGNHWEEFASLNQAVKSFNLGDSVKDVVVSRELPDVFMAMTSNGLLKSSNRGIKWNKINILTPTKKTDIVSLAFNPHNDQEIYYATADIFYRSENGGQSWTTGAATTGSRSFKKLMVNEGKTNTIYAGSGTYKGY